MLLPPTPPPKTLYGRSRVIRSASCWSLSRASRVAGSTLAEPWRTLETVVCDTFASRATSRLNQVAVEQFVLLVPGKGPVQTLPAYLKQIKEHPGKVSVAIAGSNNVPQILAATMAKSQGVDGFPSPTTAARKRYRTWPAARWKAAS